jgi:protein-disulfide isomerase
MPVFPSLLRRRHLACAAALFVVLAPAAFAQYANQTQVQDASALKPPPGARVAIVEFADMECPVCGRENPDVKKAAETYKIPWVRRDFPLHQHIWSTQAAINARWFDTKSKKLGDDYRDAVFANQSSIYNLNVLAEFTQKFAQSHGLSLPFALDPQGTLAAQVKADYDLGVRTGVDSTPTVWVVADHSKGAPYVKVATGLGNLYQLIDQALSDTKAPIVAAKAPVKRAAAAKASVKQ